MSLASKRFSVCLEATVSTKLRAAIFRAFKQYPDAIMRPMKSEEAQRLARGRDKRRRRTAFCRTRQRTRQCRFCIVPSGVTPSSRRFFEAVHHMTAYNRLLTVP